LLFLGIDCLDLGLVLRWHMREYIVGYYGYHFVGYDLYTPIIWAKMLTGIDVTKPPYRFNSKTVSRKKRLATLYYVKDVADKLLHTLFSLNTANSTNNNEAYLRRALLKAIQGRELSTHEKLFVKMLRRASMLERLPGKLRKLTLPYQASARGYKVYVVEFPPLNDEIYSFIRNLLYFFINSAPDQKKYFLDYIWGVTTKTAEKVREAIGSYDVILWYTPYVDTASHMYYRPGNLRYMLLLRQAYARTARIVAKLANEALENNYKIIIASDHGFNPKVADHSHYGFWSTSFKPEIVPRRVEEIHRLARKAIGL